MEGISKNYSKANNSNKKEKENRRKIRLNRKKE